MRVLAVQTMEAARRVRKNGEPSGRATLAGERRPLTKAGRSTLKARRLPRQTRSQITVTAILDATVRVLLDRGYEACTTNLVAEVAGVGIGSLYEYFPHKEALVAAVVEREIDDFVMALKREMLATIGRPFPEALRVAFSAAFDELEARRDLVRLLVVEYPCVGRVSALARLPQRVADLAGFCLRNWETQHRFDDHPANHYVIATMLGGLYLSQTLTPLAEVPREAVLDALVDIMLRILQPPSASPPHTNRAKK
jgi:AcrR family transcriptional regulator